MTLHGGSTNDTGGGGGSTNDTAWRSTNDTAWRSTNDTGGGGEYQ